MPEKSEKSKAKSKANTEKSQPTTDLSVGEVLRRARISEKLSLDRVETDIRIRASMLQAIEDMNFEKLPGWIYAIGFVRTYSEYLNLDGDKMISLLKSQVGDKKKQSLNFPTTASESSLPDLWVIGLAAGGLVALVISVFLFQMFMGNSPQEQDVNAIPPVPVIEKYAETQVSAVSGVVLKEAVKDKVETAPSPSSEKPQEDHSFELPPRDENGVILPAKRPQPEEMALKDYKIIIDVLEDSWVEISDANGKVLVSRVLKKGDQYYVPEDAEGLTLTTGNIAGIQITVDGQKLKTIGKSGDIRRDIPLDPQSLKEIFP